MSADLTADVVVVGSGVAGALTAAKLAEQGVDTLIVEAGPRITHDEALATFYASSLRSVPDTPYPNAPYARRPNLRGPDDYLVQDGGIKYDSAYKRIVGGTTWHWAGESLRLLPSDMRMSSEFGLAVDWPYTYDVLAPWYDVAEQELGVAGNAQEDLGSPRSGDFPMPALPFSYLDHQFAKALEGSPYKVNATPSARNSIPYAGRSSCCGSGSCVPLCPSGAKYHAMVHVEAAERAGARVVDSTVVHGVDLDAERRVAGLRFKRPDGSQGTISAQIYVLAANGLETPKILLMSHAEANPGGVANSSDQVGRNLMGHPTVWSTALSDQPVWPYNGPMSLSGIDSTRWGDWRAERPAFRIIISNSGWAWPYGAPVAPAQRLIAAGLEGEALDRAIRDHASRQVVVSSMTDQLPDPENRIVPDFERLDPIGIPRPKITYSYDSYTHRGAMAIREVHTDILGRLGASEINHGGRSAGGTNIMGTYRMGDDPKTSVVDAHLRTHDHANLFLLGSGVFPTGGAANPTLTIAALSLRAVDPILEQLAS